MDGSSLGMRLPGETLAPWDEAVSEPELGQNSTPVESAPPVPKSEVRWDMAFFGVMLYVVVEYSRLPAMFPILGYLQLGKLAVVFALLGHLTSRKQNTNVRQSVSYVDKIFTWLAVAVFLGALLAEYKIVAFAGLGDVVTWLVIYIILSRVVNTSWRMRTVIFVWLLLNLKMAQFVVRGYAMYSASGMNEMDLVSHGVGAGSTGFFSNSADLGVAMCVAWPIAISLLFARQKGLVRWVALACTFACLGAILLCGSRGAVVGAAAISVVAWLRAPKKLVAFFMVILICAGIYLVLPDASKKRFQSASTPDQDSTAHHRLLLWGAGLRMFADYPLTGVGIRNYPQVRRAHYPIEELNYIASVPHSSYIEGIAELGLAGFVPVLLLWTAILRLNAKTRKILLQAGPQQRRSYEFCLAGGLDLALIGYMASGAFVAVLWYPHTWVLLGLSAALHQIVLINQQNSSNAVPAAISHRAA